jgi:Concanavalin A-like lectin/glucanases superfamily
MRARSLGLTALVVAAAAAGLQAPAAQSAARAAVTARQATPGAVVSGPNVSSRAALSWQTGSTVWALAYSHGVVYVGGQFRTVRPPGTPAGTDTLRRTFLAAFNSTTGALIRTFDPTISSTSTSTAVGQAPGIYALAVSPNGSTVYAGGLFDNADGQYRDNLAAFSTATGALTSWAPQAYGKVNAIAPSPSGSEIYIGGDFDELGTPGTAAGLQSRTYAGAVDTAGNLLPWAPVLNNSLTSIAVAPNDSQVLIGGYFQSINGVSLNAAGAVDPESGTTTEPWTANIVPYRPPGCTSAVKTIIVKRNTAYLGAEGTGGGCYDGDFAVSLGNLSGGGKDRLLWQNDCLGATQALAIVHGYLFKGSHAHDCAYAPGGFPQDPETTGPWKTYHLLDQFITDGSIAHWTPTANATDLGPRALATDGSQLFVGGDFTRVNGLQQEGFVRFGVGQSPNAPVHPGRPVVTSTWTGAATLSFNAVSTPDVGRLIYTIYRTGDAKPLGTVTATSWPWARAVLHYTATGLKPGTQATFTVTASDGSATSGHSPESVPVTVSATSPPDSYEQTVLNGSPSFLWLLNQDSGSVAADATPNHFDGIYEPGTTLGVPGPINGANDTATAFDGVTGLVTSASSVTSPDSFSIVAWFETTTNTGGKIVGFGSDQTGESSQYDRQIYMMNDGQLAFGVAGTQDYTILSPNVYNDGRWHDVVATVNSSATSDNMALYVDGQRVGVDSASALQSYTGYWRVGGDNLDGWNLDYWVANSQHTTEPNSYYFRGYIGDVAVYPYALTGAQVAANYAAVGPDGQTGQHHTD